MSISTDRHLQVVGDEPGSEAADAVAGAVRRSEPDEPRTHRRRWWVAGLLALVAVAAGGFAVGSRVQSPDQAASTAAPPEASWITATVERRVLAQTVITRGDVRPQVAVQVGVPSSVEGTPVLTGIAVAAGDDVVEGARLVDVSG